MSNSLKNLDLSSEMMTSDEIDSIYDYKEYTAFEVFPTTEVIPAGTQSDVVDPTDNSKKLEYKVDVEPNATLTLNFKTRSSSSDKCKVIIDWGDGSDMTYIYNEEISFSRDNEDKLYKFNVSHQYQEQNKFIVKIYGNDYLGLRNNSNSIISRFFDEDLPVASCLRNMSSFAGRSKKILKIDVPYEFNLKNVSNISGIFGYLPNLQYARTADGVFDKIFQSTSGMFQHSSNLKEDINNLLKFLKCGNNNQTFARQFEGCPNITGTVDYDVFPINNNFNFMQSKVVQQNFTNLWDCSDDLKSQFPTVLGGTKCSEYVETKDGNLIQSFNGKYVKSIPDYIKLDVYIPSNNFEFKIDTIEYSKMLEIQWGDGSGSSYTSIDFNTSTYHVDYKTSTIQPTHTYRYEGNYTIIIPVPNDTIVLNTFSFSTSGEITESMNALIKAKVKLNYNDVQLKNSFQNCKNMIEFDIRGTSSGNINLILRYNDSLKTILMDNSLPSLGSSAFSYLKSLDTIELPSSITKIGESFLGRCKSIKKLEIKEGVTEVGAGLLYGYDNNPDYSGSSLEYVVFPSTLEKMGSAEFYQCKNLKYLDFTKLESIPELTASTSWLVGNPTAKIVVKSELLEQWKIAPNWVDLAERITDQFPN